MVLEIKWFKGLVKSIDEVLFFTGTGSLGFLFFFGTTIRTNNGLLGGILNSESYDSTHGTRFFARSLRFQYG